MKDPEKSILIVDDELYVRQSMLDYFEDHLWQVMQAESGEQALDLLEMTSPAAAIVDIRMGGMDGSSFIRQASIKRYGMAFVICTGSPDYDFPTDLKESPCISEKIFTKPVINMSLLEDELLRMIKKMDGLG